MRILMDVDGVVADMDKEWLRRYNVDYDDNMSKDSWTVWGIHTLVKPECGVKIYDYLWQDDLYDNVLPMDGALSVIKWLRQYHDVVYVTSGIQPAKVRWLSDHGFLLGDTDWKYANDVVITHDKNLIKGDYLVDDNVDNCTNFSGKSVLFDQPWNRSSVTLFPRVSSWADVVYYFGTLQ